MSEQIREQVSAFLDGELPNSESELLLKRLTRDGVLRESFGRYALIGEAIRGASRAYLTQGFAGRVNLAIDGEPISAGGHVAQVRASRWWRPFAGVAVAAGV
ncbi:MAG TPA: sigma-E factor negative regulatory protein, partial [Steroidobacteraceae bacterium]